MRNAFGALSRSNEFPPFIGAEELAVEIQTLGPELEVKAEAADIPLQTYNGAGDLIDCGAPVCTVEFLCPKHRAEQEFEVRSLPDDTPSRIILTHPCCKRYT